MASSVSVVIIGVGNLAHHIANSFEANSKVKLLEVFNHKTSIRAKQFAKTHKINLITNYTKINIDADVYIIAVKDDCIYDVAKHLNLLHLKGLVVHTSGSINLSEINLASKSVGVFYPLQTFSFNDSIDWESVPILIEANNKLALKTLNSLASSVSKQVKQVNSVTRLHLHLAAVFASNFTNALWVIAFDLIEKSMSKKDTQLLLPLIHKTVSKLTNFTPKQAQTGPAKRNDKRVLKKHLDLLSTNKELKNIYTLLSDAIVKQ